MKAGKQFSLILSCTLFSLLTACGGGSDDDNDDDAPELSRQAQAGRLVFNDTSLSDPTNTPAGGGQGCVSCHDPALAYTDPSTVNRDIGVSPAVDPSILGIRNTPTIPYGIFAPPFSFTATGAVGGIVHDGRFINLEAQAAGPPLNQREMMNDTRAAYLLRIKQSTIYPELRRLLGANLFDSFDNNDDDTSPAVNTAYITLANAVAAFEREDASFQLFNSKFDASLNGRAQLTADEQAGLNLFNTHCASCHPSTRPDQSLVNPPTPPLFTDFTYHALGVPRNAKIPDNADPAFFDLGLCGPERADAATVRDQRPELCGAFKVPTLRNIAVTAPYFHNGFFATLEEVVEFYATREVTPERWYVDGVKYNDLTEQYRGNVNNTDVPFALQTSTGQRAFSPAEAAQIVAFLRTLTDAHLATP
ncbi:MAG: c-type cytochrome [Gallionellaceae bacterium]|nr:c-type cytochrome [Gallionellaceae bacterium]